MVIIFCTNKVVVDAGSEICDSYCIPSNSRLGVLLNVRNRAARVIGAKTRFVSESVNGVQAIQCFATAWNLLEILEI